MANTIYNQNVVSSDKETKTQTKAAMDAILVLAALAAVFFFFFFKKTKTSGPRLPPGPKTLPIIGNLHQMEKYNLQRFLYRLSKTYGPVFKLKLGSRNFVFISSAKLAKELLKNQDPNFVNRPLFKGQQTMSYGGQDLAMNQFNSYYREMRKMCIMNLFAPSRIDAFRPIRAEECRRMLDRIAEAAEKLEVIDLSELLLSFTNSAVCRTAFGKRYNDYGDEMRRFIKILYETQALFGTLAISDLIPWLGWLDNFTGLNARIKKAFKEQDDYFEELLQEALNPNRVKPETESVMDALIQIYKDQPFTTEFTLENVKAMVMDVIVAGTDTAAAVIVWAMTFLMKNPEMLKRVQHEVRSVVGDRGYANEDDIQNLPYLRAIIKETLRLEPVIPILLHREATESTVIDGYEIPAKTILQVNAWAVSRDEEAWGEKADVFDPERFLKRDVDYKGQDFELLPFGSGRRMCPGMRLGVAMVETPFANLLYRFDFSLPAGMKAEDIKMDVQEGLAMHKKDHLMLVPKLVN